MEFDNLCEKKYKQVASASEVRASRTALHNSKPEQLKALLLLFVFFWQPAVRNFQDIANWLFVRIVQKKFAIRFTESAMNSRLCSTLLKRWTNRALLNSLRQMHYTQSVTSRQMVQCRIQWANSPAHTNLFQRAVAMFVGWFRGWCSATFKVLGDPERTTKKNRNPLRMFKHRIYPYIRLERKCSMFSEADSDWKREMCHKCFGIASRQCLCIQYTND